MDAAGGRRVRDEAVAGVVQHLPVDDRDPHGSVARRADGDAHLSVVGDDGVDDADLHRPGRRSDLDAAGSIDDIIKEMKSRSDHPGSFLRFNTPPQAGWRIQRH